MLDLMNWQSKKYEAFGEPVRILCIDGPKDGPIVGICREEIHRWAFDGTAVDGFNPYFNLTNVKTKREGWINIYAGDRIGREKPFKSKEEAMSRGTNPIATIKIEWEE